jgi:hypothetical protein
MKMTRIASVWGVAFFGLAGVAVSTAACGTSSSPPGAAGNTTPTAQSSAGGTASPTSSATASGSPSAASPTPSPTTPSHQASTAPATTSSPTRQTGTPACQKADLGVGTWKQVLGSSGAGHVAVDLAFQNTSNHSCTVTGFPRISLYSASGAVLPTTVTNVNAALASALTVTPGSWIHSELRISPDIPGPGEPQSGPCEPASAYALVRLPGDSAFEHVTLDTPTTVCEKGAIDAKPFLTGPSSPPGG